VQESFGSVRAGVVESWELVIQRVAVIKFRMMCNGLAMEAWSI